MSRGWDWKSGDWWIHCDSCGKKIKASESKERWDGFRVCAEDWEPRHSMDFLRSRSEKIAVEFVRKQPDVFITVPYNSYWDFGYTVDGYIDGDTV